MNLQESSQQDEGFYPNQLEICQQERQEINRAQQRPINYQANQLAHIIPFSKFPLSFYQSYTSIPIIETLLEYLPLPMRHINSKVQQVQGTMHDKYVLHPEQFKLIYSKYGDESVYESKEPLSTRCFRLANLFQYQESQYSPIKEIQTDCLLQSAVKLEGSLEFDSRFECGNLFCVFQSLNQLNFFHCIAQNDTNTTGYSQWFYFSLRGIKKNTIYRFLFPNMRKNIVNFEKGMKPVIFSYKKMKRTGSGWLRRGYNLSYKKSTLRFNKKGQELNYYELYFELDFDEEDDFITVSFAAPYSYSRLIYQLQKCRDVAVEKDVLYDMSTISYSLSNNQVPEIVVTSHNDAQRSNQAKNKLKNSDWKGSAFSKKKIIVIMARQHPCETHSSFLMEEILYALVRKANYRISWLLDNFEFRIFPMINVDGVIYGNSRCDIGGFDLNRRWRHPIKDLHPQIWEIKNLVSNLHKSNGIAYCLDLHAHSKNLNVFSYGFKKQEATSRLFSYLIFQNCPFFHFQSCRFGLYKSKEATARAVLMRMIKKVNVATIQCSYFGVQKDGVIHSFQPQLFQEVARGILYALKSYLRNDRLKKQSLVYLKENLSDIINKQSRQNQNGSDSEPEADLISCVDQLQILISSQAARARVFQKLLKASEAKSDTSDSVQEPNKEEVEERFEKSWAQQIMKTQKTVVKNPKSLKIKSPKKKSESLQKMKKQDSLSPINKESSLGKWKVRLQKLKKVKTEPENPLEFNFCFEEKCDETEAQPSHDMFNDSKQFRKEMRRLYKNLRYDQKEKHMKLTQLKRDSQFIIRNSLPTSSRPQRLQSLLSKPDRPFKLRLKVPSIRSFLLTSEKQQREEEAMLLIKSQHYGERESSQDYSCLRGREGGINCSVVARNLEQEFSRLKLQYSQRCDANISMFTRLLKKKERIGLRK